MGSMIRMPQLGLTMTEGTVVKWLKRPGDAVKAGEAVAQIETDKLTSDVESETAGVLLELYAAEGAVIPVQGPLAFVGTAGETPPGRGGAEGTRDSPGGEVPFAEGPAKEAGAPEPAVHPAGAETAVAAGGGRIVASPLAKKTALALGVPLAGLRGSGPGGRIVQKDVVERSRFAAGSPPAVEPAGASLSVSTVSGTAAAESSASGPAASVVEPLSGMRKTIGRRMTESLRAAPQVTLMTEAVVDAAVAFRERMNAAGGDARIGYTDLLVKLSALALDRLPGMNSSLEGEALVLHREINIGVAVSVEGGLLVPVVRNADRKGLLEISREVKDLAAKAREGRLAPEDMSGGTFTVSSLGAFDVDAFTPIVNLPECAILGAGRVVRKPIVKEDGEIAAAAVMTLSLSFDHRIADGADAAKFLKLIKDGLEDPFRLLL